ncbi:YgaP family membrane protein, partial [Nocardia anaemiae]|uniref:YgaP family membrane protein n=1 Tax=Nocardia anaemiae TaxID=263910 RepID=UPI0007A39437
MNIDRAVLALAGTITLLGLTLAVLISPWFLLLTAFAGANQLQASVIGFCPAATLLRKLGLPAGCAF